MTVEETTASGEAPGERVLIVEDDPATRSGLAELVQAWGFQTEEASDGEDGLRKVTSFRPAIIVSDLVMPRMGGHELLRTLKDQLSDITFLLLTAQGTIESAVEAIKDGAYDYLSKPVDPQRLRILLQKAVERQETLREVRQLRRQLREQGSFGRIVGNSPSIRSLYRVIEQAAPTAASVLIWGESGTGKELVAQTIHELSPRASFPFVAINCAAIPETLLESEIFGHEKGAFTGAHDRRTGVFELAHRGTLFLDEIAEMMPATQVKLLRVLQERTFRRLGGRQEQTVDVRVIAATNRDPSEAVRDGKLREDLFYRLNVFTDRPAAAARPPRRHPAAGADVPQRVQLAQQQGGARGRSGSDVSARALPLAGQHPRAAQRHRACDDSRRRRFHRSASPAAAGRHPQRADAADGHARAGDDGGRGGAAADSPDAGSHAQQQDARRGDPRHQPQDAAQQAQSDEARSAETGRQARLDRPGASSRAKALVSIKAKQVAGVTALVVLVVAGMTAVQMASLDAHPHRRDRVARRRSSKTRCSSRRGASSAPGRPDPYKALREDGGLRSLLEAAVTVQPETNTMLYAAIVDNQGIAVAHSTPSSRGEPSIPSRI